MTILCFELSMPSNNAWNNRWSGEERYYAVTRNLGKTKRAKAKAEGILDEGYFTYNFGDGWCAGIKVKEVDAKQAARIRRTSKGVCGYDWMVDSILMHKEIRA